MTPVKDGCSNVLVSSFSRDGEKRDLPIPLIAFGSVGLGIDYYFNGNDSDDIY